MVISASRSFDFSLQWTLAILQRPRCETATACATLLLLWWLRHRSPALCCFTPATRWRGVQPHNLFFCATPELSLRNHKVLTICSELVLQHWWWTRPLLHQRTTRYKFCTLMSYSITKSTFKHRDKLIKAPTSVSYVHQVGLLGYHHWLFCWAFERYIILSGLG